MFERFTDNARTLFLAAFGDKQTVAGSTLLSKMVAQSGYASLLMKATKLNADGLRFPSLIERKKLILSASLEAQSRKQNYVGSEHILLAILKDAESTTQDASALYQNISETLADEEQKWNERETWFRKLGRGIRGLWKGK